MESLQNNINSFTFHCISQFLRLPSREAQKQKVLDDLKTQPALICDMIIACDTFKQSFQSIIDNMESEEVLSVFSSQSEESLISWHKQRALSLIETSNPVVRDAINQIMNSDTQKKELLDLWLLQPDHLYRQMQESEATRVAVDTMIQTISQEEIFSVLAHDQDSGQVFCKKKFMVLASLTCSETICAELYKMIKKSKEQNFYCQLLLESGLIRIFFEIKNTPGQVHNFIRFSQKNSQIISLLCSHLIEKQGFYLTKIYSLLDDLRELYYLLTCFGPVNLSQTMINQIDDIIKENPNRSKRKLYSNSTSRNLVEYCTFSGVSDRITPIFLSNINKRRFEIVSEQSEGATSSSSLSSEQPSPQAGKKPRV